MRGSYCLPIWFSPPSNHCYSIDYSTVGWNVLSEKACATLPQYLLASYSWNICPSFLQFSPRLLEADTTQHKSPDRGNLQRSSLFVFFSLSVYLFFKTDYVLFFLYKVLMKYLSQWNSFRGCFMSISHEILCGRFTKPEVFSSKFLIRVQLILFLIGVPKLYRSFFKGCPTTSGIWLSNFNIEITKKYSFRFSGNQVNLLLKGVIKVF